MRGTLRFARVDRVYLRGGVPCADITDTWGGVYRAVRFLNVGGGAGCYAMGVARGRAEGETSALPTEGSAAEVAVLFPETLRGQSAQRPWIVGGLLHPDDAARVEVLTAADPTEDYRGHHVTDHVIVRDGARVVVSELAGVVLQGAPGQPLRLQVQGEDKIRLSSDGEADDAVLLATPTREYLDGLAQQVDLIRQALIRLEQWAISATGAAGSVPSYGAWPGPGSTAPLDPVVGTQDAVESAVVAVSSKAR